jgi:hypothetical protein
MHLKRDFQIALLVILLIGFKSAFGQDSTVWFENGATWHYGYGEGMEARSAGYEKLEVIDDTVINSIDYRIIKRSRVYSNEVMQELDDLFLRYDSENDQVYRYIDSEESLLYDFSADKGDTIIVKAISFMGDISFCRLVVDSIKVEVFSDSIHRRVQYCRETQNPRFMFGGKIIEGIGSEVFLFPVDGLMCDAGCADDLRCYQDSKITLTNPYIECEELVTNLESNKTISEEIIIFPNPTNDELFVGNLGSKDIVRLELLDKEGKLCFFSKNSETIDLKSFSDGVYIVKVILSDQSMVVRKIIKINER